MKERFRKAYRHPTLDAKLSKARLTQEVRCMSKASKQPLPKDRRAPPRTDAIYTPTVYLVDEEQQRIYMEKIEGITVNDRVRQLKLDQPDGTCQTHNENAVLHPDTWNQPLT